MQLMSIEDLAVYLGDSKRTIYKYIAEGDCPPYIRISSKNIKFDRAEVDAWLESKKVESKRKVAAMSEEKLKLMPRAKQAQSIAAKKAKERGNEFIGSEDLLIGIAEVEDCIGAIVLKNLGIDMSKLLELYEKTPKNSAKKEMLDDTAKMAVRCAGGQALAWGHKYLGTEHMLIGIMQVTGGQGYKILTELGVTIDKVREEIAKLIVCSGV